MFFKKIFLLISLFGVFSLAQAQTACPKGLTNDPYPGECGLYTDVNKDKICDLSQDESGKKYPTVVPNSVPTADSFISENKETLFSEITPSVLLDDSNNTNKLEEKENVLVVTRNKYNLFPLASLIIVAYLLSLQLVKRKIINLFQQRLFWNLVLLISFLISAILGIFLVIKINFGWMLPFGLNFLYWHVEMGVVMTVVSFFHLFWHRPYFKCIIKKK